MYVHQGDRLQDMCNQETMWEKMKQNKDTKTLLYSKGFKNKIVVDSLEGQGLP